MEHEVFIPVPAETLREALRDHARVARCVPGLQQDADASARPLSGRLKVRVGGHTITYRGALTLTERAGAFTAKGEGAEVRGTGATKVSVRISLTETPGGTTVAFTTSSTPTSEGRLSDVARSTAETTARRLLDRFAAALAKPGTGPDRVSGDDAAAERAGSGGADRAAGSGSGASGPDVGEPGSDAGSGAGPDGRGTAASDDASDAGPQASGASGGGDGRDVVSADEPSAGAGAGAMPDRDGADADAGPQAADAPDVASADEPSAGADAVPDRDGADAARVAEDDDRSGGAADAPDDASGSVPEFDGLELPDDPDSDPAPDLDASAGFGATASGDGDFLVPLEPPAEAAHARRTMIGRSAEEVDHAPPRGRYAPEQGPDSGGAGVALRWVAPAAALAIAGAVVVGRALRRRR
ncbi:SRPBCC family protein [Streptomyces niveus]|uniref:SRPBCC family protein n=1 Tax=Streptomyces niveus TaxID=193462 RepID=UPI0034255B78